jgi:hypothetical protein
MKMTSEDKVYYIVGAIANDKNYKMKFDRMVWRLREKGWKMVINPCCVPDNLPYERYAYTSMGFVNACDCLVVLNSWKKSVGAKAEIAYARMLKKEILFEKDIDL